MIIDFMSIGLWAQVAMLDIYCIYWTVWDRFMQVMYLGRAPRTKETLPNFLKWRRVTRPPLVFRGLTGSQRTPGFWGVTVAVRWVAIEFNFCSLLSGIILSGGAGGMKDAGRLSGDTVNPSLTASWFSINSFCSS